MSLSTTETAGSPMIGHGDTIEHFLTGHKDQRVTIRLESGADLTGTIQEMTGPLVHLSDLTDPGGGDAVIVTKHIAAVILRAQP
jgi:hypothetical protein